MGIEGVSMGSLLLILVIVMLLFGTKRIRNIGEDLGAAVKSFRRGMNEIDNSAQKQPVDHENSSESNKKPSITPNS